MALISARSARTARQLTKSRTKSRKAARKATKTRPKYWNKNTVLLWRGASLLNPDVTIGAFLTFKSKNIKTGDMPSIAILRLDMFPSEAVRLGLDGAICGEGSHACKHRGIPVFIDDAQTIISHYVNRTCYVNVPKSIDSIFRSYSKGNIRTVDVDAAGAMIAGRELRFGSYGDPAALPLAVLATMAHYAHRTVGYSHQWQHRADLRPYVMASCDTPAERQLARASGFRTFSVRESGDVTPDNSIGREILCPASDEGGMKTQCVRCGLCSGKTGDDDRRADVFLPVHGPRGVAYFSKVIRMTAVN